MRGFKDHDKTTIDKYAGTSTRYAQKLICSEAVRQGWDIATTDISKAFLQGVTYEELSKITGEPVREVNFYLSNKHVHILRKAPGLNTSIRTKKLCIAINPEPDLLMPQSLLYDTCSSDSGMQVCPPVKSTQNFVTNSRMGNSLA